MPLFLFAAINWEIGWQQSDLQNRPKLLQRPHKERFSFVLCCFETFTSKSKNPALILYAFCRLADDAIDDSSCKQKSFLKLNRRLELVYKGKPLDTPYDRAFTAMVEKFQLPKTLPQALLEGMKWDAEGRQYENLSDLKVIHEGSVSSGVMMCVIMGARNKHVLARACDLGVAMQLTNIARDIGEDAREENIYTFRLV